MTDAVELGKIYEKVIALERRVERLEKNDVTLNRLVTSVEVIVVKMTELAKSVDKLDTKVDAVGQEIERVKQEPAEEAKSLNKEVIRWVIFAVLGYIFAKLTGGAM